MHQFPPTIWQLQDWSFGPYTLVWIILLIVALLLAMGKQSSAAACRRWSCCGTLCTFIFLLMFNRVLGADLDDRSTRLIDLALFAALAVLAAVATLRTARAHSRDHEDTGRAMLGGTFVALCVMVFPLFLWSAVSHPREASRRTECRNNLKQVGLAMHNYHDVYDMFPAARVGQPDVSWRVTLLPYVDQKALYDDYDATSAWDSAANSDHAMTRVNAYNCPSRPKGRDFNGDGQFLTAYVVPTGEQTIFSGNNASTIRSITDGSSNTLLALEACGTNIVWTEPRDMETDKVPLQINAPSDRVDYSDGLMSSWHSGGAQALLADGSVRFVSRSIDPAVLKSLLTKANADDLGEW